LERQAEAEKALRKENQALQERLARAEEEIAQLKSQQQQQQQHQHQHQQQQQQQQQQHQQQQQQQQHQQQQQQQQHQPQPSQEKTEDSPQRQVRAQQQQQQQPRQDQVHKEWQKCAHTAFELAKILLAYVERNSLELFTLTTAFQHQDPEVKARQEEEVEQRELDWFQQWDCWRDEWDEWKLCWQERMTWQGRTSWQEQQQQRRQRGPAPADDEQQRAQVQEFADLVEGLRVRVSGVIEENDSNLVEAATRVQALQENVAQAAARQEGLEEDLATLGAEHQKHQRWLDQCTADLDHFASKHQQTKDGSSQDQKTCPKLAQEY
ncbi:hypothetical protein DFQ26_001819, partial [Actinomortierella ambigua]